MAVRSAKARWTGDLKGGSGTVETESAALDGAYSFSSRFEEGSGTNPEELIAAAHAGCFSMALSNILAEAGHTPDHVATEAQVHLEMQDEGPAITRIHLVCDARVPGLDDDAFREHAEAAKSGCPVSQALSAVEITLDASLEG
jgi:osmotically inducible protein OsmC